MPVALLQSKQTLIIAGATIFNMHQFWQKYFTRDTHHVLGLTLNKLGTGIGLKAER